MGKDFLCPLTKNKLKFYKQIWVTIYFHDLSNVFHELKLKTQ